MAMDSHEAGFLAALKADIDDEPTRLVYADWLEDQGRYEECQRQRNWTASKKWIVDLLAEWGGPGYYDRDDDYNSIPEPVDFHKFVENTSRELEESLTNPRSYGSFYMSCGANMSLQNHLNDCRPEFFKHMSILTGLKLSDEFIESAYFSCSC